MLKRMAKTREEVEKHIPTQSENSGMHAHIHTHKHTVHGGRTQPHTQYSSCKYKKPLNSG